MEIQDKTVRTIESEQSSITIVADNLGNVIGTLIISKKNIDQKVEKVASQPPLWPSPKP